MKIDRSYKVRGKPVHLHELTDIVAVRGDGKGLSADQLDAVAPEVPLPQVRAFERAGWNFVDTTSAADVGPRAKVYVKKGGRLALDTGRLVVRVAGDSPDAKARELFAKYGLTVLGKVPIAPGLFQVAVDGGTRDAVEVAGELTDSGAVEFAEPEFLEYLDGR